MSRNDPDLLSAEEACRRLGVKRATLYSYVSRGKIRRVSGPDGRSRRYIASDVERVRVRSAARAGHAAVAEAALRWGEPVLDSGICLIRDGAVYYRGRALSELLETCTFEDVVQLLWGAEVRWATFPTSWRAALRDNASGPTPPIVRCERAVDALADLDPRRFVLSTSEELERAATIVRALVASMATSAEAVGHSLDANGVAEALARSLGCDSRETALLDAALITVADHELNVSAFTARIVASAGADIYACLDAAFACFSGTRHGRACDQIEALVDELEADPHAIGDKLLARLNRGESVPGFGHRLYPEGDPRCRALLALLEGYEGPRIESIREIIVSARQLGIGEPTIDLGMVALSAALSLPPGTATALFAVGRTAGWVAHILEQRQSTALLRPRARYVGPEP